MEGGPHQRRSGAFVSSANAPLFPCTTSCLSYHSHPCEPIRSPSIVIPSEAEGSLLHCRHMHTCALTQTTPWCFLFRLSLVHDLPVCKKNPSTSALMTRKKDGCLASSFIPLRRVVPLRGTLSCAFGAALLQGPTRWGLSHMGFHVAGRIVSCAVVMPARFPTICDYRQTRSPLEKGLLAGDYLTWAFMPPVGLYPALLSC